MPSQDLALLPPQPPRSGFVLPRERLADQGRAMLNHARRKAHMDDLRCVSECVDR
jgi:hypothetical protein